jgi:uncharacterized membrane protein YkvA (DUF1232 family)
MMRKIKSFAILISGLVALIYLLNPTAGLIELIPDNVPFIGNLDEGAAMILLIAALRHFGVDITKFFNKEKVPPN